MRPKTAATSLELFPAEPEALPPNTWMIELRGSPPRPNRSLRGKAPTTLDEARQSYRQRLALQAAPRKWIQRTGWALVAAGVPKGLERVRVSVTFFRAALDVADEDGDMGACKPLYDSIVRYGCVPDDTRRYMVREVPDERKRPAGQRYNSVRLIIEALPARE